MLLILDSNEYIFALGAIRKETCERLIEEVAQRADAITVRVTRLIIDEVRNNLTPEAFKEFMILINKLTKVDEEFLIPFELGAKYEAKGFKPADALIAAFAEYVGADVLVSENRHFLLHASDLSFKILSAEKCLTFIRRSLK